MPTPGIDGQELLLSALYVRSGAFARGVISWSPAGVPTKQPVPMGLRPVEPTPSMEPKKPQVKQRSVGDKGPAASGGALELLLLGSLEREVGEVVGGL